MEGLPTLARLLRQIQHVPYLASRNIYRVASHFLQMEDDALEQFCAVLKDSKKRLAPCQTCNYWREMDRQCQFCAAPDRDQTLICVVEMWYELQTIEKTRAYEGVYHVLGGAICPLEGIGPEDLAIDSLIRRAQSGAKEIILALGQTPEGEATASFIARKLSDLPITVTCLARGMPVGSSIGSMDRLTVYKALSERRPF